MGKNPSGSVEPTVTFRGAARTVTGSLHQLDVPGQRILLDCGLFQGPRAESALRNRSFPFKPKSIDAVILSHAHIDHCGNLPSLVQGGFKGPIFCTPATRALAGVMLGDSAKIQEEDARYWNRHREPGQAEIEPLYTGRDVFRTLLLMKAVPYENLFAVGPDLEARFVDAGHLLGSAMVHLRWKGTRTLTFTGDLGRPGIPILREPAPIPPADMVICESTYGGMHHEPVDETAEHLGDIVRRTAQRGGKVIIPAFSVGRTQTIIFFLHQLREADRLPELKIFVDSPMALRATEVFQAHPECFNEETLQLLSHHPHLFGDRQVHYIDKVNDSVALNHLREPCVIISASGMCEAGRILHHLRHNIEDPRSTILIAGYQAPDTLGRRIVERRPEVRILGQVKQVKAEVVVLNGLSSHADHGDLLRNLQSLLGSARKVCLVHADGERAEKLAADLRPSFPEVLIPSPGDQVRW